MKAILRFLFFLLSLVVILIISLTGFIYVSSRSIADITHAINPSLQPEGTIQMICLLQKTISSDNIIEQPFLTTEKIPLIKTARNSLRVFGNNTVSQITPFYIQVLMASGETREAIAEMTKAAGEPFSDTARINEKNLPLFRGLAMAYLRMGEQDNCLINHNTKSCIIPFEKEAYHIQKSGAENAIELYTKILKVYPDELNSRWLLNVAHMALGLYPDDVPSEWLIPICNSGNNDFPKFTNIAGALGIAGNEASGGVIIDDFNNDGYLDLVTSSLGLTDQLMYFENDEKGGFIDKTESAGLLGIVGGLNIVQTDYNNDGLADIYVPRGAWMEDKGKFPNSLLKNLGNSKFEDVTIQSGILSFGPTQVACWADFNNDGWLDVFIGKESGIEPMPKGYATITQSNADNPENLAPSPSELLMNNGNGTFTNVIDKVNLHLEEFIKGATWVDYDNDGLQDLFVSILGKENKLYKNMGGNSPNDWWFEDVSAQAGIGGPLYSFAAWAFDYDNDGWQDLYVQGFDIRYGDNNTAAEFAAEMLGLPTHANPPALYHNNGNGTFTDYTSRLHLDKPMFGMGCNFGDLDNDGFLDFYIGTGAPSYQAIVPNRMFRNISGKFFEEVTYSGGFGSIQKGHGVSFADVDNDGDQDVYIVLGGAFEGDVYPNALFQNPGNGNSWITIKLQGTESNKSAIGATLKIVTVNKDGAERAIYRVVTSGGSFGANPLQQQIGLGDAVLIKSLSVTWPGKSQNVQLFENIAINQFIRLAETEKRGKIIFDLTALDTPWDKYRCRPPY